MTEIMSAEEFARETEDIVLHAYCGEDGWSIDRMLSELVALTKSRDSAIIEKCKEAIINRGAGISKGTPNDAMSDAKLQSLVFALDTVLSDINGGK